MHIIVLAGGCSPERDVSLSSGSLIANALLENGHHVLLLDLYCGIAEDAPPHALFTAPDSGRRFSCEVPAQEPDLAQLRARSGNGRALIGARVLELCRHADLVFIALHGDIGENGTVQAVFDAWGIPYTGTGYAGSLLAMDKDIAKTLLRADGIPTPDWICVRAGHADTADILRRIGLPCVVKPAGCGSSVGVTIVQDAQALHGALDAAARYGDTLLAEKMIVGRELSVGVLGGQALPVIEIIPKEGFYDYKNKYQQGRTEEICPARLTDDERTCVQSLALRVHNALRLGDYARVDFILDAQGTAHCLEANALPGMTPTSLLPQEAAQAGIPYRALCERIVQLSLDRNA